MSRRLLNYTRKPIDEVLYDPKLAYSMHLALEQEDGDFLPLNHNSGVLFAKATENADGSLNAKSMKNPFLFSLQDGSYGILAVRTLGDGEDDEESRGSVLLFTTKDFIDYQELGLLHLDEEFIEKAYFRCGSEADGERGTDDSDRKNSEEDICGCGTLFWLNKAGEWHKAGTKEVRSLTIDGRAEKIDLSDGTGINGIEINGIDKTAADVLSQRDVPSQKGQCFFADVFDAAAYQKIEGIVPHNVISISEEEAAYLERKLLTPVNTGVVLPEEVTAGSREELEKVLRDCRATALYSDGSTAPKSVDWEIPEIDFSKEGTYYVRGRVHQEHFAFPVAFNRADPCVAKWGEKYYFIATNDADENHTLYIREADTIPGLADAEETLLLDSSTYPDIGGLLWAPEFHEIEGKLYIFHAATTGEFFREESHIMALREGGNPSCRKDWSRPRRIVKKDGSELCEAGKEITLDMTCFLWEGDYYVVWSERQFLPKDLGAWLYIAKLNPGEPWKLLTDPVVLSKPEYGWANNHTFVDEGPFALPRGNTLYLTFSSAAVDTSYVVGLFSIEKGKDLLKAANWKKKNYPILTSRSVEGEYGTGHNAYVTDEEGTVWNTYHARPGVKGVRSSGIRRVHFDVDGEPRLDVTEELDVKEEFRNVEIKVLSIVN